MSKTTAIVWFRNDLRLADNPALTEAASHFSRVIPIYIWDPEEDANWIPGAASRVWLHHSLLALQKSLKSAGSNLFLRSSSPRSALEDLIRETGATAVFWNRRYDPAGRAADHQLQDHFQSMGISIQTFASSLLLEPQETLKKDGTPYLVFTPFARAHRSRLGNLSPLPVPAIPPVPARIASAPIPSLDLLPTIPWHRGIESSWTPGEAGAQAQLKTFVKEGLGNYAETRNLPAVPNGVSRLSPYLHNGELSPRQVWTAVANAQLNLNAAENASAEIFLTEIQWREFSHQLLYHFPRMPEKPLRSEFERYPWRSSEKNLHAWQRGQTGYPIVDAGMRQLWQTGWMHNRVRMIVGSFLIKDLGISWQTGEEWFWDTLVDADLAQNAMNWQWVAGCGADASPFFRIFNPVTQGKKFDPTGEYIRRYVPELAGLPDKWIHAPFDAPADVLAQAQVELGGSYPKPLVDHSLARTAALKSYKSLR